MSKASVELEERKSFSIHVMIINLEGESFLCKTDINRITDLMWVPVTVEDHHCVGSL